MTKNQDLRKYRISIVGATGVVGREMIEILNERNFPIESVVPFASARSQGKLLQIQNKSYRVQTLKKGCFADTDLVFFDASDAISKEWVPEALSAGAWVIDHSAVYRMNPEVPLVIPEINGALIGDLILQKKQKLISGPNCTTAQLVMALKPLHDQFGLKRLVVSTYQSVSGAGSAAMDELSAQTVALFNQSEVKVSSFKHQIAFNCIPQIGSFLEDGFTSEELKVIEESKKILDLPELRVTCTAVRVPVFNAHSESVNAEFTRPVDLAVARKALEGFPGIRVVDQPGKFQYPMNQTHAGDEVKGASKTNDVLVGRIRKDPSVENGLQFWVVADNLRKGAALNAIQIGEVLIEKLQ